ncbi:PfkB family carbohydrate kinase [Rhodococcus sp. NBC_00294]|uniref:PfkB family carbohydrate kinase n=1 Tax=Rhodococcus sp. NBC_00294 TaxID=2976004 RepID=UPI002E2BDF88|nr:PfkB family carbohydrate kinase [Rhodococcus sp. NBC_00294]
MSAAPDPGPLVIVGDTLLDVDVEGVAERLSPEAPVPVVDVARSWCRPGGAGLAALISARHGVPTVLVTAVGVDAGADTVLDLLERDVEVVTMPLDGTTVRKTRVQASGQPLLRLDSGDGRASRADVPTRVSDAIASAGAVLVSDYGRGVAANPSLRACLDAAAERVPVVWDPHPRGPAPVRGTMLATPNLDEARRVTGAQDQEAVLDRVAAALHAAGVAVTTGSRGAVLVEGDDRTEVPIGADVGAAGRGADTCGAGDRFATAAAAALLGGATLLAATRAAVDAAARFVVSGGAVGFSRCEGEIPAAALTTVPEDAETTIDRVRRAGGRIVATGGCFDLLHTGHVSLLRQARLMGDALVVCLNSDASVARAKGPARPVVSQRDRARVLLELGSVDAVVVFDDDTPTAVLDRLRPDVWVKGSDYAEATLPEAETVRRHGGDIVLVPVVGGYSTTRLVDAARARPA